MQSLLAVLHKSERRSLEENLAKQKLQLKNLLQYAKLNVPFYKDYSLDAKFTKLPIVTRAHLQSLATSFTSRDLPKNHGQTYPMVTSGSTGQAVQVLHTDFTRLFYDALMLREHQWHARDFTQKLMLIRGIKKDHIGDKVLLSQKSWGGPIDKYHMTGPSAFVDIASSYAQQIASIQEFAPFYILSYPSQLAALASYCLMNQIKLPSIYELRTTGERLTQQQIKIIKQAFGNTKLSDVYSCVEIGNLAQQCPEHNSYHVNLEHIYLEVVDDNNQPCPPGVPGRVLVTNLLNYATPLIRYEIGDIAIFQNTCPCGRGLPVLKSILGRSRSRLLLPNGEHRFPYLGEREDIAKISQIRIQKFQFVQRSLYEIDIKVVSPDRATVQEEQAIKALYKKTLGQCFNFHIEYVDNIDKSINGKAEDFISCV